jgi:hypothetical protein
MPMATLLKMMQAMEREGYRQRDDAGDGEREGYRQRGFMDGGTALHLVAKHLEYYRHGEVSVYEVSEASDLR